MTPKEKAIELEERFRLNVLDYEGCSINSYKAKQCALIAVDEMIRITPWGGDIDNEIEDGSKEFYMKVKEELEKI